MSFLNPTYLWALLGLAVPVAIHLWSKREGKTIKIGSIRLLREGDPKQTSNLKLNELLLLLLRMLIISILVLILAEPRLRKEDPGVQLTYLIEPSLLSYDEVTSFLDTLNISSETKIRLLKSGFPEYEKEELVDYTHEVPNYWQLTREMEKLNTDSLVVFTNAFVSGIRGKRPQVSKNINWVLLDPGEPLRKVVAATNKENEVELISVLSDHKNLKLEKELIATESDRITIDPEKDSVSVAANSGEVRVALKNPDSLSVLLVHNDSLQNELRYLQSAYKAIAAYLERPVEVQVVNLDNLPQEIANFSTVVWLSSEPVIGTSSPVLIYRQDSLANKIIENGTAANEFYLTRQLNSENIVEQHLPEKLLVLFGLHKDIEEEIKKYDRRIMAPEELQPVLAGGIPDKASIESSGFQKYLWLILLALLVVERAVARYRKQ